MEKLVSLCIASGQKSGTAAVEKCLAVSQKVIHRTTIRPSSSTPRHICKRPASRNLSSLCTPIFIAVLFIRAKWWKQPECPSADEWTDEIGYSQSSWLRIKFHILRFNQLKIKNIQEKKSESSKKQSWKLSRAWQLFTYHLHHIYNYLHTIYIDRYQM